MTLTLEEIARYLRIGRELPEGALEARVAELRDEALALMRPRRAFARFARADLPFASSRLDRHLGACTEVYLACGTIGGEFDALLRRRSVTSGADAFALQAVGAAAIERWMDDIGDEIRRELRPGETLLSRYSPGYGDLPLEANRAILALLDAGRRLGVSLTETSLLLPSKTVTAVIGVVSVSTSL